MPQDIPISAWLNSVECVSPNGAYKAEIDVANEVAMGAPTRGTLTITETKSRRLLLSLDDCNPSLVWASDSTALAIPQWTRTLQQRLCIISMPECGTGRSEEIFRVLELHTFASGKIVAVDSPIYMPRHIEFPVDDLFEHARKPH